MLTQLALVPVNALGNYILIYGHFGAPAMGASGAALSSAIVLTTGAVAILTYLVRARRYRPLGLFAGWTGPQPRQIAGMLRLSLPIAVSMVMETSMFTVVAMLMGRFGEVALAAHHVAINWAALTYMVPVGLAMAVTVRVGHAAGAGDQPGARLRGLVGIVVCGLAMLLSAMVMILFPQSIIGLYTGDAAVAALAGHLFLLAALFQISDGLQIAAAGALRGLHDTTVPMLVNAVSYWVIGLPAAWLLGVVAGHGPTGMWAGLVLGLTVAAVLLNLRFLHRSRPSPASGPV
jgi:MATE family multidrug resistance protein